MHGITFLQPTALWARSPALQLCDLEVQFDNEVDLNR